MKKLYLPLVSLIVSGGISGAFAEESSNFTAAQTEEIKKIVAECITANPELVVQALQADMEKKQKEELEKMHKALAKHKHKIFKNPHLPTAGNPKGSKSLVVFADPYCGFCQKLQSELPPVIEANADLKVLFVDIPIMGDQSVLAVKAMLAAHRQGKYEPLQKLILKSKGKLTHKKLVKHAKSVGMDIKKFEADLEGQEIQAQLEENQALAQELGVNATPLLIINETNVAPGYVPADELIKMVRSTPDAK